MAGSVPGTGEIVVFKPFFSDDFDEPDLARAPAPPNTYNTYTREYIYRLTPRQLRAMVLAHEYRHSAGTLSSDHDKRFAAENEAIIDNCLRGVRREPSITAPPDPIELAPIDGILTTLDPPTPLPPPPLPDGEGEVKMGPLEGEPGFEEPPPGSPVYNPSDAATVILGDGEVPLAPVDDVLDATLDPPDLLPPPDPIEGGDYDDTGYDDPGLDTGYDDWGDDTGYDDSGYDDSGYDDLGGGYDDTGYDDWGGGGGYGDPEYPENDGEDDWLEELLFAE